MVDVDLGGQVYLLANFFRSLSLTVSGQPNTKGAFH